MILPVFRAGGHVLVSSPGQGCLFNKVLFSFQARVQRANVLLKQGEYDDAEVDYRAVVSLLCRYLTRDTVE